MIGFRARIVFKDGIQSKLFHLLHEVLGNIIHILEGMDARPLMPMMERIFWRKRPLQGIWEELRWKSCWREQQSMKEEISNTGQETHVTRYTYDLLKENAQVLTKSTDGEETLYAYGLEQTAALTVSEDGGSCVRMGYTYDYRGSVVKNNIRTVTIS